MTEKRYPGLDFIVIPHKQTDIPSSVTEIIDLNELSTSVDLVLDEPLHEVWTQDELIHKFTEQLKNVSEKLASPQLDMSGRTMIFVSREGMRPKTEKERQWLIDRYGTYVADGGVGDCARNPDGTFTMRIGYAGQEHTAFKDDVLEVMAHEYGHTLGEFLQDPVSEELKAYAFSTLFMRHYFHVDGYIVSPMHTSTIHSQAKFQLEKLLLNGTAEEAVIAELIGQRFGAFIS